MGQIRVVTDSEDAELVSLGCEICRVKYGATGFEARAVKTRIVEWSFDLTLYLDADTVAIAPIGDVWEQTGRHKIAMCLDMHRRVGDVITHSTSDPLRRGPEYRLMEALNLGGRFYYNSGVMLFHRSPEVIAMFEAWHREWARFRNEDQLALVRALSGCHLEVRQLAARWNERPRGYESVRAARLAGVKILHFLSRQRPLIGAFLPEPDGSGYIY